MSSHSLDMFLEVMATVMLPLVTYLIRSWVKSRNAATALEGAARLVCTLVLAEDREYRRLVKEGRWNEDAAAALRNNVERKALDALSDEQRQALEDQWGDVWLAFNALIESAVTGLKGRTNYDLVDATLTELKGRANLQVVAPVPAAAQAPAQPKKEGDS